MTIDWDRRRRNIRILIAARGTNATTAAREARLSPNTLTQFLNGTNEEITEKSLRKLGPVLGWEEVTDLDTDNVLGDPRLGIKRLLDNVPDARVAALFDELKERFSDSSSKHNEE